MIVDEGIEGLEGEGGRALRGSEREEEEDYNQGYEKVFPSILRGYRPDRREPEGCPTNEDYPISGLRLKTEICEEIRRDRITHHDLRHLFAMRCIEDRSDSMTY